MIILKDENNQNYNEKVQKFNKNIDFFNEKNKNQSTNNENIYI